jgi:tetratricopeptide (TPR) repeat protein
MPTSEHPLKRVGLPSLALAVFYWTLFVPPESGSASAAARTPDQMRSLMEHTRNLIGAKKFEQALEPALQLAAAEPGNHSYLRYVAQAYQGLQRYEDEARAWEMFQEHAPLPIEACPQVGIAYLNQSKAEQAFKALEHCYQLDHENVDSIFYLALSLERKGQAARAAKLYREGLRMAPGYTDLEIGLARATLHLGQAAQARQAVEKVLARQPSNVDALLVAGLAAWRTGDRAAARAHLEKGIKLSPGYTDFRTALDGIAREEARR